MLIKRNSTKSYSRPIYWSLLEQYVMDLGALNTLDLGAIYILDFVAIYIYWTSEQIIYWTSEQINIGPWSKLNDGLSSRRESKSRCSKKPPYTWMIMMMITMIVIMVTMAQTEPNKSTTSNQAKLKPNQTSILQIKSNSTKGSQKSCCSKKSPYTWMMMNFKALEVLKRDLLHFRSPFLSQPSLRQLFHFLSPPLGFDTFSPA